jgi:hypothetical protein
MGGGDDQVNHQLGVQRRRALCTGWSVRLPDVETQGGQSLLPFPLSPAISGDLLSAVILMRCILGFRKDNPNVFNMLV